MYLQISNFRYGLDTRRAELSSVAGTLVTCRNAVINQGGEVEKRKAFVEIADLNILDTDGFPAVFGLLAVGPNLVAFGSAYPPYSSELPRLSRFPSNIIYQQLLHPAVAKGATYDPRYHRMTGVSAATVFRNKPWVVAVFGEDQFKHYIAFHGSDPVPQWYEGFVLPGRSALDKIAEDIADAILREKPSYSVEKRPASVVVRSPETRTFVIHGKSFDPELYVAAEAQAVPTIQIGASAVAVAKFVGAEPNAYIERIYVGGPFQIHILQNYVPFYQDIPETVRRIAAIINDGSHGFRATASGQVLRVFAPVGSAANGVPMSISHSGFTFEIFDESNPPPATPLQVVLQPDLVTEWAKNGTTVSSRSPVRLSISGGTPPYTIVSWNFSLVDSTNVTMGVPNTSSTENVLNAALSGTGVTSFSGSLNVTVKDSTDTTVTSNTILFSWVDSGTPTGGTVGSGDPVDKIPKDYY